MITWLIDEFYQTVKNDLYKDVDEKQDLCLLTHTSIFGKKTTRVNFRCITKTPKYDFSLFGGIDQLVQLKYAPTQHALVFEPQQILLYLRLLSEAFRYNRSVKISATVDDSNLLYIYNWLTNRIDEFSALKQSYDARKCVLPYASFFDVRKLTHR